MPLNDCRCGKPVRLGAFKITVNRRRGVSHYIAHMDGSLCRDLDTHLWTCCMLKPYPHAEGDRAYKQMIDRWNDRK